MKVTATDVFVTPAGVRRGRICRRVDGLYQYVTEYLVEEGGGSYWRSEYPPSGIYNDCESTIEALMQILPSCVRLAEARETVFDITVGPYPDPVG